MTITPVRGLQTGRSSGRHTVYFALSLCALSTGLVQKPASAQSAADVITKMTNVYKNAKTFQVTMTSVQVGKTPQGKPASVKTVQQIHYQGPNRFHTTVKLTGTGEAAKGPAQQQLAMQSRDAYSDGTSAFVYVPALKKYSKQAAPPSIPLAGIFPVLRNLPGPSTPGLSLGAPTSVGGRAAYVVEIKPTMPPNLKPEQKKQVEATIKKIKQPLRFVIDKQNYQLIQISQALTDASTLISMTDQSVDTTLAPATFVFTPPAGTTEYVAPKMPSLPAGAPGNGSALPPQGKK